MRRKNLFICTLAGAAAFGGCGEGGKEPAANPPAAATAGATAAPDQEALDATGQPADARITISLKDVAMQPRYITAVPGQTLVFRNDDDEVHQIKGTFGEPFTSKKLEKGATFELKMDNTEDADGISFLCPIHTDTSKMTGTVVFRG